MTLSVPSRVVPRPARIIYRVRVRVSVRVKDKVSVKVRARGWLSPSDATDVIAQHQFLFIGGPHKVRVSVGVSVRIRVGVRVSVRG